ncbi:MAG TPA: class I SAM-dependent methyltransferase [Solirubrobacterales bacterium]|nr:class I SAM-dependent methyltransferase [Solirubrobacterales bacterium]
MEASTSSAGALLAYEAIAPAYDDFTAHHNYEMWLGNLLPELEKHGIPGTRLLDVACGTGKSFLPMLERGWQVTACDLSPAMIEIARAKVGDRVPLSVVDMRELPVLGEFDLCWCLDDAVNYLLEPEELEEALRRMRRNLVPGGLLMFDVNTLEAYKTFFSEEVALERGGKRMIWKGLTDPGIGPGGIAEASFQVQPLDDDAPQIPPEVHRERHYPEEVVRATLERAGLEFLEVFGHHFDAVLHQPLSETAHAKAVYFARAA